MVQSCEVVITGVGIVSPIGIGKDSFWKSLSTGQSGVRTLDRFQHSKFPFHFAAEASDFEPKQFVRPRKSLKVMCRTIQTAFASAEMALQDASLVAGAIDPDRMGVVLGSEMIYCDLGELEDAYRGCIHQGQFKFEDWGPQAMSQMNPLWLLKYLPNMASCHIGIANDARAHNNAIVAGEASSLLAVGEAVSIIQRGWADAMIAGGAGERMNITSQVRRGAVDVSCRNTEPQSASRPFDANRDGMVVGEGSAAFLLESRESAERRGAPILARILSCTNGFEPSRGKRTGSAIRSSIEQALRIAQCDANEVGHVNAHGLSTVDDDRIEAQAIHAVLGDVPVTAPKSFFGNLGAGSGAVEMAASVLSFAAGEVPPTLNYETPDPTCPVNVIAGQPLKTNKSTAVVLSQSVTGQAATVVLAAP